MSFISRPVVRFIPLSMLFLVFACYFKNSNPLDPDSKDYRSPSFELQSDSGYVKEGDTVHRTSARLSCKGNRDECLFQIKLNDGDTTAWQSEGIFLLEGLKDTVQNVIVNCKYRGGIEKFTKSVIFYVLTDNYIPKFSSVQDTTIYVTSDSLQRLILSVLVTGSTPISFQWYKDTTIIHGQVQNDLLIKNFGSKDTGVYYCIAANEYDTVKGPPMRVIVGTIPAYVTITYDGNGNTSGDVPFDANTYSEGSTITVKMNVGNLEKTSFIFNGWYTQVDGGGISYFPPGAEIKNARSDIILYASWSKIRKYSLQYLENEATSGKPPVDANQYDSGAGVIVMGNIGSLKKENYTFVGWNTAADNSGVNYHPGVKLIIHNENVRLYAKWTQRPVCKVVYDGNGNSAGTVPVDTNSYEIGSKILTKNAGDLVRTDGYSFIGWNTLKDGNGTFYGVNFEIQLIDTVTILYANWTKDSTFSITYNGNGNTSGEPPVDENDYKMGAFAILKANESGLARAGYRFRGWCTDNDGAGKIYSPSDTITILGPTVFFANWYQIVTFNVVYNGNGNTSGTVPVDTMQYEAGSNIRVHQNYNGLKKDSFVFAGWNTASDGNGTQVYPGSFLTVDSSITLYARWTQSATISVTYNANGSTSGVAPVDSNRYISGASAKVKLNSGNLSKAGFSFVGWTTQADGSGISYATEETFTVTQNVTLYAKWSKNVTFNVTYNGNSNTEGTVPVDANAYESGFTAIVKGNTGNLSRDGYKFTGWNRNADGSGTVYTSNSEMKIDTSNVVLYAVWTKMSTETFKVYYFGNSNTGGSIPTDNSHYTKGTYARVLSNSGHLVKTGYLFAGWSTGASETIDNLFMPGDQIEVTDTVKLYAVWTQDELFKVIYMPNGAASGTVPYDENAYLLGISVTVKGNSGNLEKTGSTFSGWNTKSDGKGDTYTENTQFVKNSKDDTLYAKWSENPTYSITYFSNNSTSGRPPSDVNTYETGVTVTVKHNSGNLVRMGYEFIGWNTRSDGSGDAYAGGTALKMPSGNLSLYADWKLIPTFTVKYDGNGNTAGTVPLPETYQRGQLFWVKGNTGLLQKDNLNFSGWNTLSNGSGDFYAAGSMFPIHSDITLYAIWTSSPIFTVTYNGNGANHGNVPVDGNQYRQGGNVQVKANTGGLARNGFLFSGWSTSSAGSGTFYAPGAYFTMGSSNVILWAVWTPYFTVNYTGNGNTYGSSPIDTTKYKSGEIAVILGQSSILKDGFTFSNWNTLHDAKGKFYKQNDTMIIGYSSIYLHAAWKATVTFDGQGATSGPNPSTVSLYHPDTVLSSLPADPSRTGYTFAGWYTAESGETQFTSRTKVTGDRTVYARWNINQYTLTYDGNNSTGGTAPAGGEYNYNSTLPAASNTFIRDGYIFTGWNTAANGSGTSYSEGDDITITANTILYAQWSALLKYTVRYNGNGHTGGSVPGDDSTYVSGETALVLGNTGLLVKADSLFEGWSRVEGSGNLYKSGDTLIIGSSNITLYARWIKSASLAITGFRFTNPDAQGEINENTKTITIRVPYDTDRSALIATFTATGASVRIGSVIQVSNVTPNDFSNPVTYTVYAADNSTQEYVVTVTESSASSNADLSALTISTGTLIPSFSAATTSYAVDVEYSVSSIILTGTSEDQNASISDNSGVAQSLTVGENAITLTVTAQNGTTTKDYVINVRRAFAPVSFSELIANGESGKVTTTELTLTFNVNPTTLTESNITLTGATRGALTGTGLTRTLVISNITVADGQVVTVAISNPPGYEITGSPRTIAVYKAPTTVNFSALEANGASGEITTTELKITFDTDPTTLTAADITIVGAVMGQLSGTGTSRIVTLTSIDVANGKNVKVTITNPTGFTISPPNRVVSVFVRSE
ncbi:MAG: InlB B-repeat-containing protein [Chitinispirillaceae bacterium]|nr:InlB B-repeat-containing protein [Chitinispirillaceae bacterium]